MWHTLDRPHPFEGYALKLSSSNTVYPLGSAMPHILPLVHIHGLPYVEINLEEIYCECFLRNGLGTALKDWFRNGLGMV